MNTPPCETCHVGIDFSKRGPVCPDLTGSRHGNLGIMSLANDPVQQLKWFEPTARHLVAEPVATTKPKDRDREQLWQTTYAAELQ